MATLHIDRLLETCVKRNASDLHLHVGRPPVIRLHGRLRSLETKVLEPDDTVALMKQIAPDRFRRRAGRTLALPSGRRRASVCRSSGRRGTFQSFCG